MCRPWRRRSRAPGNAIFREGIVDHELKELCRVYVSKTIECDY